MRQVRLGQALRGYRRSMIKSGGYWIRGPAGLMAYLTLQDFSFIQLKQVGGARVPIYIATFILAVPFYW